MSSPKTVEDYLNQVNYSEDASYTPSDFSLGFINFIKLVNGDSPEENKTPILHYRMLDKLVSGKRRIANMVHRGAAKTTLFGEYLILYLAVFGGHLPNFGRIEVILYVSDSIDNGVKNMRKNLEYRYQNSSFLQHYLPSVRFTDIEWNFVNKDGINTIAKSYGASTGVRGVRAMGTRPKLAILDDLISDEDAKSETILRNVEDTVYKAITHAMHPTRSMIIWSGTPFNAKDPLYKAIESGAWNSNVYPVCEKFPCEESEFRGSWEDRFTYQYVKQQYEIALKTGTVAGFDQELMLRIMSDDDRLISEGDLGWYDHTALVRNKSSFNFYITTDFATSERQSADYSVISVWALNNKGFWYWVDGICARQNMAKNLDDLFRLVVKWNVLEVGIEVSGQQGGFIPWIQDEMLRKNCFFTLASANNSSYPGIKPTTNKLQRFNVVVPWFKQRKVYFPRGYDFNPALTEMLEELRLASVGGFRSKHDDALDTISMLALINAFPPSEENTWMDSTYRHEIEEPNYDSAYIV